MNDHLQTICEKCEKPLQMCVCDVAKPVDHHLEVLILQHPQEPDKVLGTAHLAEMILKKSTLKVALSVANLKKALAREDIQPNRWGVLYLGSAPIPNKRGISFVDRTGKILSDEQQTQIRSTLQGIVVLDGTWSQAKALWWRNAWLLKCQRMVLNPKRPSLYGDLRKEPKKQCLSTIEALAQTLEDLGEHIAVHDQLIHAFATLLEHYKNSGFEIKKVHSPRRRRR